MRNSLRKMATLALFSGLLVYVVLLASLYWNQANLVYFPTREVGVTPGQIGLDYQDVELLSEEGVLIRGWFLAHPNPSATLLFLHGNAGNIGHRLDTLELFHRLGLAVLVIDYRGYGGIPTPS
ncbi:MAG: hypothetical protein P8171_15985 [Candidatus Thiodiazotropha sp.]